ncbi:DUF2059 domain-containing protein [Chitiniphilus purpureus]|uniref:DUF2059 domain-containing protein n=1 Tax=Chitiniphilus purpureus TaxID=2981137 RepID=A0ABY6DMS3_9NEIS|nr:DUF2059 domain-containing protein [Chitiniphilus sp. CD1]UXY14406.1 DUF2059 domain-containing protein [Chitiniphilus sp. CD1]
MRRLIRATIFAAACLAALPALAANEDARAEAQQLLEVMNYRKVHEDTLKSLLSELPVMLSQQTRQVFGSVKMSAAQRAVLEQELPALSKRVTAMVRVRIDAALPYSETQALTIDVMAEHFTADEIRDIATFYRTPTGQKTLTKLPEIMRMTMQKTMPRVQAQMQSLAPEIQKEFEALAAKVKAAK